MIDVPHSTTQSVVSPPIRSALGAPETAVPSHAQWLVWLPIPLLLALIAGLWVADLRTVYESRAMMVLLNLFFTWLASLCICFLSARAFLSSGQPGLLMFGCGSLLWGVTSLAAAMIVDRVNPTITVHNLGILEAAVCHLVGSLWRGRLARPGRWLVVGYASALMAAALIIYLATAGLTPLFFVQGQGGTPIRQVVLLSSIALFVWVAWQMIYRFRQQSGAFYYWYGLGLALVATGLIGVLLLSVQGGILGWTNRLTQYLGSAYLFVAAFMAARAAGTWTLSLTAVDDALQKYWLMVEYRRQQPLLRVLCYSTAVVAVAAGYGLRLALEAKFGPGLPPYITFYPAIMAVALLAGFGPCLLAMASVLFVVGYWILPPVGQFSFALPVDRLELVIFTGMGLFMSLVAEFHRHYRDKAAAYDREAAVRETRREKEFLANLLEHASQPFVLGYPDGRLGRFNHAYEELTGYTAEELRALDCFDLLTPPEWRELERQKLEELHRTGRPVRYEKEYIRKDGSRVPIELLVHFGGDAPGNPAYYYSFIADISERKRSEEVLRDSEQFHTAVLNSLAAHIAVLDGTGCIVAVNEPWIRFAQENGLSDVQRIGVGVNYLEASRAASVAGDPFAAAALHGIEAVLQGRQQQCVAEYPCHSPDQQRWFLMHVTANAAEIGGAIVTHTDITQRKRAEESLRESEEQSRLLFEAANDGVVLHPLGTDREGCRFTRFNTVACRMLGYTAEEMSRLSPLDIQEPPNLAHVPAEAEQMRSDGRLLFEKVLIGKDGRRFPAEIHSTVVEHRGQTSVLSIIRDITERNRAEERTRLLSEVTAQLLASDQPQGIIEALCRRVLDHLNCHVFFNFLVDEQRQYLRLNAFGGISEEAAHQIESLDFGVAVCGCAARDGCRIVAEHIQTTPDPRTDLVRSFGIQAYACHPLLNQGQTIGTLSFGSRLKPAFTDDELGLMKAVADHVAIAMQRIRLLESLERHARAAEAANEAKSQFLANMSHELRTPMNAILGMIDVALPKATDPTVQDCLQTAKGAADLLLTLLNDLLDSAKIESGKLELESAPFSLRRMLDQITRVLAVRASEKGLAFYCRLPDETPDAVVGDRMRLQQVLLNLASNAIKFTERGDVEIGLRALSHDGEACLEFAVRDTGIGIPPSGVERLFQPFAQADASMARRFGGTGLGLTISKSLVEMMGGRIWVESELGVGSTFYFTVRLPLAKELPADYEAPITVPTVACAQLRILLVEDNPANQKLANYILQDRGHLVEIAGDGQEAVYLAERNRYDVILMDVQMPGMNGLEATAAIRKGEKGLGIGDWGLEKAKQPTTPGSESQIPNSQSPNPSPRRVPIIAMTAHAMRGDRDRCLAAGMDGYLSKPINAQEMLALVESLACGVVPVTQLAALASNPAETSPQATAVVFNPEEALSRCFNSRDMVREMMQCFFDEVNNLFPQMRAALEKGDLLEVGRLGHRMKGTVVYLGAEPAKEASLVVEQFCKCGGGTPAEAEEAVNALEYECDLLKHALAAYRPAASPADRD